MDNSVILVDNNDVEIGCCEKMKAHVNEYLHRAFSLFIYDKNERKLLIHKRALEKYHSGGLWTNSCCSHPQKGECLVNSIVRRTQEELGVDIGCYKNDLIEVGKFHYYKKFKDCAENEIDHVFILVLDKQLILNVNKEEITEIKWKSIEEIEIELKDKPDQFTAWFPQAFHLVVKNI